MTLSSSSFRRYLALSLGFFASLPAMARDARTISVVGEGEAWITPDQVELTVGIDVSEAKVELSKSKSDEAMRKILAVAKQFKIEPRDIQSDYIRVQPIQEESFPRGAASNRTTVYNTRRDVRILLRDITAYENLITGIFNSGANNLHSVNFRSSAADKLEADARLAALKNAKSKAEAIAQQVGLKLGRPLSVNEGGREPGPAPMMTMALKEAYSGTSSSPTLAPGEIRVRQVLSVVYEAE